MDSKKNGSRRPQVLLIDDNNLDGELLDGIFQEEFNDVDFRIILDGDEAMQFLKERRASTGELPHFILLDLNLPGMNGIEILSAIRGDKSFCHLPVVIFSSSSAPKDIADSFCHGANAYVVKPLHLDQLIATLHKLMDFWFEVSELPFGSGYSGWKKVAS